MMRKDLDYKPLLLVPLLGWGLRAARARRRSGWPAAAGTRPTSRRTATASATWSMAAKRPDARQRMTTPATATTSHPTTTIRTGTSVAPCRTWICCWQSAAALRTNRRFHNGKPVRILRALRLRKAKHRRPEQRRLSRCIAGGQSRSTGIANARSPLKRLVPFPGLPRKV